MVVEGLTYITVHQGFLSDSIMGYQGTTPTPYVAMAFTRTRYKYLQIDRCRHCQTNYPYRSDHCLARVSGGTYRLLRGHTVEITPSNPDPLERT